MVESPDRASMGRRSCFHDSRVEDRHSDCERQLSTSGIVIAHDLGNHNQYGYRFQVDGNSYTGWQSPQRDELTIGKEVRVFYDPQNPSRNSLINFHDASTLSLGPVPMMLFGIGAVGVSIFYRRRKMAHQQEQSS